MQIPALDQGWGISFNPKAAYASRGPHARVGKGQKQKWVGQEMQILPRLVYCTHTDSLAGKEEVSSEFKFKGTQAPMLKEAFKKIWQQVGCGDSPKH